MVHSLPPSRELVWLEFEVSSTPRICVECDAAHTVHACPICIDVGFSLQCSPQSAERSERPIAWTMETLDNNEELSAAL